MQISKFPLIILTVMVASLPFCGCSSKKTDRGYLIRHEWACEINRTPWIGCPPDSGCYQEEDQSGFLDSKGKGCVSGKKYRRHCGGGRDCTSKNPCCKTLGCGMWVDPKDPMVAMGGPKACGLTPFCSPMKPCGLTPYCGKATTTVMNPSTLMLGNNGMVSPLISGGMLNSSAMNPTMLNGGVVQPTPTQTAPEAKENKIPSIAGPHGMRVGSLPNVPKGTLLTVGIVPGVSTITTGGIVAAAGAASQAGVMTPSGVLLPNGQVQGQGVIRACALHPNCTAARPCGMTAGCGMIVPLNMVSNNAVMLASALTANGAAGSVSQAGGGVPGYVNGNVYSAGGIPTDRTGTGMLVNPITGQPVGGLSMTGRTQTGYPPMGYAPTGYSPGFPRYAPELNGNRQAEEEEEEDDSQGKTAPTPDAAGPRSEMPVPRFHSVPSKPTFQRSEGISTPNGRKTVSGTGRVLSRESLNAAMEQAYLEGIADAMEDVQDELDLQAEERAKAELHARIMKQSQNVQAKLESQQQARLDQIQQVQFQQSQLQQFQIQQAQLQQAQLRQQQLKTSQGKQESNKGFFAATRDFFTGAPSDGPLNGAHPPRGIRNSSNQYAVQQPMVSPSAVGRSTNSMQLDPPEPGLLNSAKETGKEFLNAVSGVVSPIGEKLTGNQHSDPVVVKQQRNHSVSKKQNPAHSASAKQVEPDPLQQSLGSHAVAPVEKTHQTPKIDVSTAQQKINVAYPCPPCPPFEQKMNKATAKTTPRNRLCLTPLENESVEQNETALEQPTRPPTVQRVPKKNATPVNEEDAVQLVQQAGYLDRQ